MSKYRRLSVVGAVATAFLFAGCEYFSSVVIPATDTDPPMSIAAVYDVSQGKYVEMDFTPGMYFEVSDPTVTYLAVGATYDPGGAKSVITDAQWIVYCQAANGDVIPFVDGPIGGSAEQTGKVGDTVSNGVWTYYVVRFDQAPYACPTWAPTLDHIGFYWQVSSTDFHDNRRTNDGVMVYTPPR